MKVNAVWLKQCCSCEMTFINSPENNTCPNCGSKNWVFGYLDEPETFIKKNQLRPEELEALYENKLVLDK